MKAVLRISWKNAIACEGRRKDRERRDRLARNENGEGERGRSVQETNDGNALKLLKMLWLQSLYTRAEQSWKEMKPTDEQGEERRGRSCCGNWPGPLVACRVV